MRSTMRFLGGAGIVRVLHPHHGEQKLSSHMSRPEMESLFSDGFFAFIRASEHVTSALASAFQRLPPALQELERSVDFNSDLVVRQQYRTLRRSLFHGASLTMDYMDLLNALLSLRQDEERWGLIDKELEATASSGTSVDKRSSFPHLSDLEEELRLRVKALREARERLNSACQEIQREKNSLLVMSGHVYSLRGSRNTTADVTLGGLWLLKNTTGGVFALGTVAMVLGITGVSPLCSQALVGSRVPFGIVFLICIAVGYKFLARKYSDLERERMKGNEAVSTLNRLISDVCGHVGTGVEVVSQERIPVPQVRLYVQQHFSQGWQSAVREVEAGRAELQVVVNSLQ